MPRKIWFIPAALFLLIFVRFSPIPLPSAAVAMAQEQAMGQQERSYSAATNDGAILGGDIAPVRVVADPYPVFDGIGLDPTNNVVALSDENHHAVLIYDRSSGSKSENATEPRGHIIGPATELGFTAGVTMDPQRREVYTVNNDTGDQVTVYSYESTGNSKPLRRLFVPHQSWGLSLGLSRGELAVSTQELNAVVVYSRDAKDLTKPLREIVGDHTGLEDPHGVVMDEPNKEIFVANHGNWTQFRAYTNYDPLNLDQPYVPGRFDKPSITVYPIDATGDAHPVRIIQGEHTSLNWPMGIAVDSEHNEVAVANYGDDSVLIFGRAANGDVVPIRHLYGPATQIKGPIGVAIDTKNEELWVANYGDHTALVFSRTDTGNVSPKRIVRNAPADAATCGFTNASAASYDPKRNEILIPNCVSVPRVSVFERTANGPVAPKRVLEGQTTLLSRTMHGMDLDPVHDEFYIPVALSGAVLTFPGGAGGSEAPKRVIQGAKTELVRPQTIAVDPIHNEIFVGDPSTRAVLVFHRTDNGDVAPLRILRGPNTKLVEVTSIAVDPVRNLIVAGQRGPTPDTTGLLIFNRTDNGDVAPRSIIAGPRTRMLHFRQVALDTKLGKIYVAIQDIWYKVAAPYVTTGVRKDFSANNDEESQKRTPSPFDPNTMGFIGVWDIDDKGNVPPRAVIRGPESKLLEPGGVALDFNHGEVIAVDGGENGYQVYLVPQFFRAEFWGAIQKSLQGEN